MTALPTPGASVRGIDVAGAGRLIAGAAGAILVAFLAGFVVFASMIARATPSLDERAEAIVVLTGGKHRLAEAARLLTERRGERLLISGVNRMTSREDLLHKSGLSSHDFECCVDIGYEAHTTSGNAEETRDWANARKYSRLIIVTSSYHMPRSLTELSRAMPGVTLIPYPVVTRSFSSERWWTHAATARLIFSEYVKFIPSAARFGVARLLRSWDGSAVAGSRDARSSRI